MRKWSTGLLFSLSFLFCFSILQASANAQPFNEYNPPFLGVPFLNPSMLDPVDEAYFTTGEAQTSIVEVSEDSSELQTGNLPFGGASTVQRPLQSDPGGLGIIDIVLKVWDIIVANKPIVNLDSKFASALPVVSGGDWRSMDGWQPRRVFKVNVFYKNLYGMKVVNLTYRAELNYGGNVGGKGAYIGLAQIVPAGVDVSWGYNLNVKINVPEIFNARTVANPMGAIRMDVGWTVSTILKSSTTVDSYLFQGDGLVRDVNTGNDVFPAVANLNVQVP